MIEGTVITNIGNDNFNPTAFDFSFGIIGLQFKDGQIIQSVNAIFIIGKGKDY